jgi:hypothetical protein
MRASERFSPQARPAGLGLLVCLLMCCGGGVALGQSPPSAAEIWRQVGPFFTPPAELASDLGTFRSPLKFYDGRAVRTPADWAQRRREILDRWHTLMGRWPPVIEKPQVEILDTTRRENFTQHRVRFLWLPTAKTEGYLLIPDGQGRRPAVLTVYYEPETAIGRGGPLRDFAYQLTRRGFVTLSIGNREGTDNKTYGLFYPNKNHATIQPLSALAYAAANAYHVLASRPEVDPQRVGVTGHSYGGKWSMFAACLYDRFACAAWSDPGIVFDTRPSVNYWEPWYLGYEPGKWRKRSVITPDNPADGLYPRLLAEGRDLHELHALMAPRPVLVSGGSEDPPQRWQALNHLIQVNRLLGYEHRVAMTNRPQHPPTPESNEQLYLFFQYFLQCGGK